jgi:hypothetical protein
MTSNGAQGRNWEMLPEAVDLLIYEETKAREKRRESLWLNSAAYQDDQVTLRLG